MRKYGSVFLILLLVFLLCSCGLFLSYEDSNGDEDYTLQTISENMIIKKSNYSSVGSFESTTNNKSKVSINKFNGVKIIETFRKNTYTITVSFKVTNLESF